jgi:hypothetical protein
MDTCRTSTEERTHEDTETYQRVKANAGKVSCDKIDCNWRFYRNTVAVDLRSHCLQLSNCHRQAFVETEMKPVQKNESSVNIPISVN